MKYVKAKLESDKHVIEAVVRRFGPISRTAIHDLTQIRPSATSNLVRSLIQDGQILEAGQMENGKRAGRKQVLLRLNEEYRFVVGVNFDEESVAASVLDLHPRIRQTVTEATRLGSGAEGLVRQLISCTKQALKKSGLSESSLLGIGIADPGLVDSRRGVTVTSSTIEFWRQIPLKKIFEQEFGVPTLVEAKTRAKTIAERMLGGGKMADNMIYLDYGAGIGAGIVVEGKLLYGHNCAAGEFGHTHVTESGPACKCGSFGCLEAVAGARAVEARIRKAIEEGGRTRASESTEGDAGGVGVWAVLKAASMGDKICSNIVAELGEQLGLGLANLVNLFNPSVIVLDRRLGLAGHEFLDHLVHMVKRQALTYSSEHAEIRFGELGNEAGVLGAALIVLERHFEIPLLKPPRFMVEPDAAGKSLAANAPGSAQ